MDSDSGVVGGEGGSCVCDAYVQMTSRSTVTTACHVGISEGVCVPGVEATAVPLGPGGCGVQSCSFPPQRPSPGHWGDDLHCIEDEAVRV